MAYLTATSPQNNPLISGSPQSPQIPPPAKPKKAAQKKTERERSMEAFADWLIEWVSGLDEDGFSPLGRAIVWLKFGIIAIAGGGFVIPAFAVVFGLFVSHAFVEGAPEWLQWVTIVGLLATFVYFLWREYYRIATMFLLGSLAVLFGLYLLILDPIVAAQWIMIGGILFFGIPALVVLGIGGSFIAILIQRLFWKNTPLENINVIISYYFSSLIWLFVIGELAIFIGVTAPVKIIGIVLLGVVGYVLMAFFWNRDMGIGRFLAFSFQIVLLVWAFGVALPSPLSLALFGKDLRHDWGFYGLKPLAMHQRQLDKTEDALAAAKGEKVSRGLDDVQKLAQAGETDKAQTTLDGLKKPYSDNALVPSWFNWAKEGINGLIYPEERDKKKN